MVLGQERISIIPIFYSSNFSSMEMHFHPTTASGGASSRGRGRSSSGHANMPQRTCTHYGKHNHTMDTCFMKHNYPPGYHYKSSKSSVNNVAESNSTDNTFLSQPDHQILQLLQQHQLPIAPPPDGNTEPGVPSLNDNSVTPSNDGKPPVY